ncbi:c-type cytochrome [Thalassomonas haliotis]|nr:c-type cytochrome [Thalassomonas haliotis]
MKKIIFSLLFGLSLINVASAAGNAEAGKAKSAMCAACHGPTGIGAAPNYPNLAGQHADYIVKQLKAFKDGSRKDPVMAPMAAGLSEADMADLGAYFSAQSRSGAEAETAATGTGAAPAAPAAPAFVPDPLVGKGLYEFGDNSRTIVACINCHGKDGNSDVLVNPNLSKQHSQYIEKQLKNFRSKDRVNLAMNTFTENMTDEDIANIGAYFADTKAVAHQQGRKPVAPLALAADVAAGKAKAATCTACHGADGNALVPMYPKLAGQSATYIAKQLADFKAGGSTGRNDPVMAPMAAALSEQDMQELASYFSAQKVSPGNGKADEAGKKLYLGGDDEREITACVACHGIKGEGMTYAGFPAIGGQSVEYLTSQLEKFRTGERANDKNGMMRNIAVNLSKKDIAALTQYMSSLK